MSKHGVFSGPYFPALGLNTERCPVSLCFQSECRKIRIRKNSVFAHFSRSECSYVLNDSRNFNDIFRKSVAYDNIKSHKKTGFHSLSRKHIFGETTGVVKLTPPVFLGLKVLVKGLCPEFFSCSSWEVCKVLQSKFFSSQLRKTASGTDLVQV